MKSTRGFLGAACSLLLLGEVAAQETPARATILFDAFGKPSALERGWGYSALIEYGGRRILFDTGGNLEDFAANAAALGVDLSRLDFVVLSHRHGDHTSGLHEVLRVNPGVAVHTPAEPANFGTPASPALVRQIQRRVDTAPEDMHYFDGNYPEQLGSGSPWPGARFVPTGTPTEVLPGFWVLPTVSDVTGTREMNEVSLAIQTPLGLVLVVGCSHPGIEKILELATTIDARVYTILGGLHLLNQPDPEVSALVLRFRDRWKLERIAAGHCTGEFAFSEIDRIFGAKFDHPGLGSVIPLPPPR